jgi:hypothetical protein
MKDKLEEEEEKQSFDHKNKSKKPETKNKGGLFKSLF